MSGRTLKIRLFLILAAVLLGAAFMPGPSCAGVSLDKLYAQTAGLMQQRRMLEARPFAQQALALAKRRFPADHPEIAAFHFLLGEISTSLNLFRDGEAEFLEAVRIEEVGAAKGLVDPDSLLTSYLRLARNQLMQRKFDAAEQTASNALALVMTHPRPEVQLVMVVPVYRVLADIYVRLGDVGRTNNVYEAIQNSIEFQGLQTDGQFITDLVKWAGFLRERHQIALAETKLLWAEELSAVGTDSEASVLTSLGLGALYQSKGLPAKALQYFEKALADAKRAFGDDSLEYARAAGEYAKFLGSEGDTQKALALMEQSLNSVRAIVGEENGEHIEWLIVFATMLTDRGLFEKADGLLRDAETLLMNRFPPDSPEFMPFFDARGDWYAKQSDWPSAALSFGKSYVLLERKSGLINEARTSTFAVSPFNELLDPALVTGKFIWSRLMASEPAGELDIKTVEKLWIASQIGRSSHVAGAVRDMIRRDQSPASAGLREKQDLLQELEATMAIKSQLFAGPTSDESTDQMAELSDRVNAITKRIAALDRAAGGYVSSFNGISSSTAVPLELLRSNIHPDEAVLTYQDVDLPLTGTTGIVVWVHTRDASRVIRLDVSYKAITGTVRQLRLSLGVPAGRGFVEQPDSSVPDTAAVARAIAKEILDPVWYAVASKTRLVIIPSQSISALPFHLLVPPSREGPVSENDNWLIRTHAVSVVPTIDAFVFLRGRKGQSNRPGRNSYIGIGNPLLTGPQGDDVKSLKERPCDFGRYPAPPVSPSAEYDLARQSGTRGFAELVRSLPSLPETFDELCNTAQDLGASRRDILAGADASETFLKQLDADGALSRKRIIHFATHAVVSGEIEGLGEPAIVLTPPAQQVDAANDGLLRASEVSLFRLNADLVILSACNTASASTPGTEQYSGLARSFFFAGARSVLVSHWPVNSRAAVELVTRTVQELSSKDGTSGALALQRAMISIMDEGGDRSDPSYWAPFVLVGDFES